MWDVINAVPYKYLNKSVGDTSIAHRAITRSQSEY